MDDLFGVFGVLQEIQLEDLETVWIDLLYLLKSACGEHTEGKRYSPPIGLIRSQQLFFIVYQLLHGERCNTEGQFQSLAEKLGLHSDVADIDEDSWE